MLFKMLTVVDEEDDIPRSNSEHRKEPDKRADLNIAIAEQRCQHTADERRRQRDEGQECQPPAGENNLQQQQDADARGERGNQNLPLGGLPFGDLPSSS